MGIREEFEAQRGRNHDIFANMGKKQRHIMLQLYHDREVNPKFHPKFVITPFNRIESETLTSFDNANNDYLKLSGIYETTLNNLAEKNSEYISDESDKNKKARDEAENLCSEALVEYEGATDSLLETHKETREIVRNHIKDIKNLYDFEQELAPKQKPKPIKFKKDDTGKIDKTMFDDAISNTLIAHIKHEITIFTNELPEELIDGLE